MSKPASPLIKFVRTAMALCALGIAGKIVHSIYEQSKPVNSEVCISPEIHLFTGDIKGVVMFMNGEPVSNGRIYTMKDMSLKEIDGTLSTCFNMSLNRRPVRSDVFNGAFVYPNTDPSSSEVYNITGLSDDYNASSMKRFARAPYAFKAEPEPYRFPLEQIKGKYTPLVRDDRWAPNSKYIFRTPQA